MSFLNGGSMNIEKGTHTLVLQFEDLEQLVGVTQIIDDKHLVGLVEITSLKDVFETAEKQGLKIRVAGRIREQRTTRNYLYYPGRF
jgi:hypothetical protein